MLPQVILGLQPRAQALVEPTPLGTALGAQPPLHARPMTQKP